MAKNIKKTIKEAGPKISKKEMNQIVKATGGNVGTALNRIASVQSNMKQAGKTAPSVGSGAANMFIKQAQSNPALAYQLGSSKLGQTLRSMIGTPAGPMIEGQQRAAQPGTGLMIGGTVIKPGGGISVYRQPQGAAPAVGDTVADGPYDGMMDGPTEGPASGTGGTGGDGFDFQSMLDAMTAAQQPQFDMSALTDMFNTQFDQLSSQFDMMDPLQLNQVGRAYGADAIRARQNIRKTRQDYRRGMPAMALGQALANMAIGGGLTL